MAWLLFMNNNYGRTPSVEWRKLLTKGRPAFLRASSNDIFMRSNINIIKNQFFLFLQEQKK